MWFAGEILIYDLQKCSLVSGNINEPYAVFGAWLSQRSYISGSFEFLESENGNEVDVSGLWANCVDELPGNQTNLARVINQNSSSVRCVLVARPNVGVQPTDATATSCRQPDDQICLIFTHGTVTYYGHQIVFKWLQRADDSSSFYKGVGKSSSANGQEQSTGNVARYESCRAKPDHCIETNARIIGMSLSPDHEYLYVNCRHWEQQDVEVQGNCEFPPEVSKDITLQVYSLSTYKLVGVHVGHKAYTPNSGCFLIFLNVANNLVAR